MDHQLKCHTGILQEKVRGGSTKEEGPKPSFMEQSAGAAASRL